MSTETFALTMIMLLCWILLTIADAALSLLAALIFHISFKKAFLWGLLSLAIPPLATLYGALIERDRFEITENEIAFAGLPEAFDGYRIVHISDIHARSFLNRKDELGKAITMIDGLEPDMIVFSGDLVTLTADEIDSLSHHLGRLKAADGVFSVLGNHDYCMYAGLDSAAQKQEVSRMIEKERSLGWNLLLDENRIFRHGMDSIAVIGVENTTPSRHFPSKGNLKKASEGTEGMFRILITHDPLHWEAEVVGQDYPLTLSGHTHAMQLSFFGWSPCSFMFEQYRGLYTHQPDNGSPSGRQHLYVNIGLGETIFPARIGARPEITKITLRKAN